MEQQGDKEQEEAENNLIFFLSQLISLKKYNPAG